MYKQLVKQLVISQSLAQSIQQQLLQKAASLNCIVTIQVNNKDNSLLSLQNKIDFLISSSDVTYQALTNLRLTKSKQKVIKRFYLTADQLPSKVYLQDISLIVYAPFSKGIIFHTLYANMIPNGYQRIHQKPFIQINDIQQIPKVFQLETRQFNKRYTLQKMLYKAEQKRKQYIYYQKLQQISHRILVKSVRQNIKQLIEWMDFYIRKRQRLLRKMFLCWSIFTYQTQLNNYDDEVINQGYFQSSHERKLKQKVLLTLKTIITKKRYINID